jgi:peptidoglycan/xylan/chitin deacetylase (PgdA/CDA1 family)
MPRRLQKQEQDKERPDRTNQEHALHPRVAFRLDDVQDLYLNDVQMAIIDMFRKENVKLTIGIISNVFGDDLMLLNHIRDATKEKENSVIRVANHGWNHEDMTKLKKEDQSLLIKLSNQKIRSTLGINPSVFIPPYFLLNTDTIAALRENNMSYVSSSIRYDPPPYSSKNLIPYHFPVTVSTSYNIFNKYWLGMTNTRIIAKIHESIGKYGYAIILLHPQEYCPSKGSSYKRELAKKRGLEKLDELIESIKSIGLDITSIEEMNKHT